MTPNDHEERLRVLRRELSLVLGRQAKPTKIPAARTPIWRRFFESQKVKEIRKSAAHVEQLLKEQIPKPETREDHDLLSKARSPEQIRCDINAIPTISSQFLPEASVRFDDFWIFQLWFAPADRYLDRVRPYFVTSRYPLPTKAFQDDPGFDASFLPYNQAQVDAVTIHADARDRSALSVHDNGSRWALSKATLALLEGDVRFCADPRRSNYDVFLGHLKQPLMSGNDPSLLLHLVRRSDQQSKHFLIVERRA